MSVYLLHDLLSETDETRRVGYVKTIGSTPFFSGVSVAKDISLCHYLKSRLQVQTDDDHTRKVKKEMNHCLCVFLNCHNVRNNDKDIAMYKDLESDDGKKSCINEVHELIKKLLKSIGLELQRRKRRKRWKKRKGGKRMKG